jgi:uncharacterized damage-inducible protein DinB
MAWADARVWETILSNPKTQEHKKLTNTIYHYHLTQYAFYYIWNDLPREFPKPEDFKTIQEMAQWSKKYHQLAASFLTELKEEDLGRVVHIPWAERLEKVLGQKPEDANLAETMFQVVTHSSYHRGQVNSHIRSLAIDPPMVDYIAWVWLGKLRSE